MQLSLNEWLTAGIAIYAALLATFTFAVQQIEKRKKIKVDLSLGFLAPSHKETIDIIAIEAVNCGNVPVHLSQCIICLPNTKEKIVAVFTYSRDFPVTLNPGESIQAFWPSEKFVEAATKSNLPNELTLLGEFSNKGGQAYRSKPYPVKVDEMLFAKSKAATTTTAG